MKEFYFLSPRIIGVLTVSYCISTTVLAQAPTTTEQVLLHEPFSGNAFPDDWRTSSNHNTIKWKVLQGVNSREDVPTGSSMNIDKTAGKDEKGLQVWAFTRGIRMEKDVVYTVSFYHQNNANGSATFNLALNNVQAFDNKATLITTQTMAGKNKWNPHEYVSTFTISTDGLYYIGFGITEITGDINLFVDEVRVTASTGPLRGIYQVGLNGHFLKPTTAVEHLNRRGIADTVVFNHTDSVYTIESNKKLTIGLAIGSFKGAGTWPVTFKAATPGAATIRGSADKDALVFLTSVNNIHLSGLRIHNSSPVNPWAIGLDKSINCSVNACTISAGSPSGNAGARGISINAGNNHLIKNNIIHKIYGTGVSTNKTDNSLANLYGIAIYGGGTNHKVYNNTISMTGPRSVAGSISAPIAVVSGSTGIDVRNNILSNTQTSTASNTINYAFYSLAGSSAFAYLDYNLYYTAPTASSSSTMATLAVAEPRTVGFMAGMDPLGLAEWKKVSTKDASSMFGQPAFFSESNLAMDPANPRSWYANGTGVQLLAVSQDMSGASRSITVATGGVDLGALEFTPTAIAPDMEVSGPPVAGERQVYYFAEREMAAITWAPSSTDIPDNFAIRYRPGQFITEQPNGYMEGSLMNSWMEVVNGQQGETSTYSYDLDMYYDEALLGGLQEEASSITIAMKDDPNQDWDNSNTVEYNFTENRLTRRSITSAAYFVGSESGPTTLPVVMLSFTVSKKGKNAILHWQTAQEINNRGFEVQASPDGSIFTTIGFVEAQSHNSSQGFSYSFTDTRSGKAGTIYYRLKQTDLDGQYEYFGPEVVTFSQPGVSISAYPNPVDTELEVAVEAHSNESMLLTLTNALGQEVLKEKVQVENGINRKQVQLPTALPAGFYLLSATWHQQTQTLKLVKR